MGQPKALLGFRGETFVGRLMRVFSRVCQPVIVVLGYHADTLRPLVEDHAIIAINPAPERGQLSSLQAALAEVPEQCDGFLFSQVDSPAVSENTLDRLLAAFHSRPVGTLLVVPAFEGKHGHPVLATREIAAELLALPATAMAREVIRRHISQTIYIDVDDPGVLTDIDTPQDYQALQQKAKRQ